MSISDHLHCVSFNICSDVIVGSLLERWYKHNKYRGSVLMFDIKGDDILVKRIALKTLEQSMCVLF